VVPTRAIQTSQNGDFVYVVNSDQTVTQRPITLAFSVADQAIIDVGLSGGETVVTDGHLRLRDGAAIKVLEPNTPKAASGGGK
jgi:multidrug efflux system membrane fusion protein